MNSWNTKVDKSIWNPSNCRSWYQDKNGRPWAMWPDPVWKYYKATSNINPKEHFLYYLWIKLHFPENFVVFLTGSQSESYIDMGTLLVATLSLHFRNQWKYLYVEVEGHTTDHIRIYSMIITIFRNLYNEESHLLGFKVKFSLGSIWLNPCMTPSYIMRLTLIVSGFWQGFWFPILEKMNWDPLGPFLSNLMCRNCLLFQ